MKAQIINLEGTPSEIKEFMNSPETRLAQVEQSEKDLDNSKIVIPPNPRQDDTHSPMKDLIDKDYGK